MNQQYSSFKGGRSSILGNDVDIHWMDRIDISDRINSSNNDILIQ